jgi:hypothetical protein
MFEAKLRTEWKLGSATWAAETNLRDSTVDGAVRIMDSERVLVFEVKMLVGWINAVTIIGRYIFVVLPFLLSARVKLVSRAVLSAVRGIIVTDYKVGRLERG